MIPENKQPAVLKALQNAFGVNELEGIQQLMKGLSGALVFKITVRGNPYLLRVITRTDAMADPAHYFGCMQTAAKAGLAPVIHYLNSEDRISITDFIIEQPFPVAEARDKLADTLRHLHALPKFPYRVNYIDVADGFLQKFRASHILPERATKDIFELYARIGKVYPRNDQENLVSCHNDLKPDNIIYDGARSWLIDWEAAFLNDRYVDLAAIANFIVRSDQDETDFLERYFGGTVDEYQRARFFLMSQIVHMFCFTLCTLLVASGKSIDTDIQTPGFREFHDRLWRSEINLANPDEKRRYAWVHMEELLRKMQLKRFDESLYIVSQASEANGALK